jgi:DnaJ-class molecular chaperone
MKTPLASPPEDLAESAAGEEDPGSAIDVAIANDGDTCPQCGGSGTLAGLECSMCHGTGKVTPGAGAP